MTANNGSNTLRIPGATEADPPMLSTAIWSIRSGIKQSGTSNLFTGGRPEVPSTRRTPVVNVFWTFK